MNKFLSFGMFFLLLLILHGCEEPLFDPSLEDEGVTDQNGADSTKNATTNCDYSLLDLNPGENISIGCLLDLKGETISLAKDVTLTYDGGDIINGTLVFDQGQIDGRILNKTLDVQGDVALKDPTFVFDPSRWDIVPGKTDKKTAFQNRLNLESLMLKVKSLKGTTFKMDSLDAYFEVTTVTSPTNQNFYPSVEAINVPGDFNLVMSDQTHLRVFPNDSKKYGLLVIDKTSNSTISGGILYGDRDEHDYSGGGTHEWGHVLILKSAVNATITGVTIRDGSGDGMKIEATAFSFQPNYQPSYNILVTGCTFDSNRRNNLSITSGHDITVEHNQFFRAGIDTEKSSGTNPRFSIDIEANRTRENGKLVLYEKVERVIIRNNVQKQGARGGFLIAIGDEVTIEDNDVENGIAYKYTQNSIIRNNTVQSKNQNAGVALSAGVYNTDTMKNNKVYGNTISGFAVGLHVAGDDNEIFNNTIINCKTGIAAKIISNTKIVGNTITSSNPSSRGIFFHLTSVHNVLIKENKITVPNNPFKFDLINTKEDQKDNTAQVVNNEFNSKSVGLIRNSTGISFMNNTVNTGIEIFDSNNFSIENNDITSDHNDGIYLREKNKNIKIMKNAIDVPQNKLCIKMQSTTRQEDIDDKNNECLN